MKIHVILILLCASLIYGCKNEQNQTTEQTETAVTAIESPGEPDKNDTIAQWEGTYSGATPCLEPCKGLKTTMIISRDSTYLLSEQALGQEQAPRVFKGKFYWDKTTNIITLDAEGDHHKFEVREGSLKVLDKFGDPKQLGNQEDYILKKQ